MMVPFWRTHSGLYWQVFLAGGGLIYPIQEKIPEILLKSKYILLVCSSRDKFPEYIAKVVFSIKKFMIEVN